MVCGLCTFLVLGFVHFVALMLYFRFATGYYKIKKNLKGKTYVVTGATAGCGKATARQLALNGATVYLACRNVEKAERVRKDLIRQSFNNDIHIVKCDMSDFASVKQCAEELISKNVPIDCLINNAGVMYLRGPKRTTKDGNEEMIQANHLGHFLLTNLLLERLIENKARIVNVSSIAGLSSRNHGATKNFDPTDLNFERHPYNGQEAYGSSKLANLLFTRELSFRLIGKGATTNACHPGGVNTDLLPKTFPSWVTEYAVPLTTKLGFMKTAEQGAMTQLYLATSDDVPNVCGEYFADCAPGCSTVQALNAKTGRALWKTSEEMVAKFMPVK